MKFAIETKTPKGWEKLRGKYRTERDAQKAVKSMLAEAQNRRTTRAGAPLPEYRVVEAGEHGSV